jgi:hypothetical protein
MALVAVSALAVVPATASAATITRNLSYSQVSGDSSTPVSHVESWDVTVQYDCSTNTFSGSGGRMDFYTYGPGHEFHHEILSPLSADATIAGTAIPGVSITLSVANLPRIGSFGLTVPFFFDSGYLYYYYDGTYEVTLDGNCRRFPAVTSADQCKGDGWKAVSSADDITFKNQGDCVSYVVTKGKNKPAGS